MKKLSIDIETFSDIDLIKCGVYKYADSPAFEILLFAYSIDDGEINIIDLVKNKGIKVIFSEELIDPKVAETIAKETGAKVLTLSPLEGLSEEQVKNQDDYFSIMKADLSNLLEALK